MAVDADTLAMLRTEPEAPELDLSWLDPGTEWGIRARPSRRGLTLDDINIGSYGDIPEYSNNETMLQRGAARRDGTPRTGWRVHDRGSVWSDNATLLYEEAVQRQWSSATDIPWETLEPLPDELELAMCQLCTFLTEVEFIAGDTPGKWLPRVSNDHYEVKLFLASQIMDEARHLDVFRKRALANGGGLLSAGPGTGLRAIIDSQDFSEMSAIMHLVGEGFIQSLFRSGELISTNEAEKRIFRLAAQDESRHVAFGVMHMKYILETEPWRREELHSYLDIGEGIFAATGVSVNPASMESLAILLGGGLQKIDEGIRMLLAVRRRQVQEYVHRLEVAGLGERKDRISPRLRMFLD
ncbi:MAG TPA: ferritin-like domain-containing protein [Dehalococcoidia bacterium]|nr:ferritin-like domain-containing protein [Dehalococcoidia bacterium]